MLIKTKTALAAALVLGSVTAGFAQGVVPEVDGDGNRTGVYDVLPGAQSAYARGPIGRSFAGPRHHAIERSFAGTTASCNSAQLRGAAPLCERAGLLLRRKRTGLGAQFRTLASAGLT